MCSHSPMVLNTKQTQGSFLDNLARELIKKNLTFHGCKLMMIKLQSGSVLIEECERLFG
jgi:hypothetical protein